MHVQGHSLHVGRIFGQPVSVHASLPIGLLLVTGMRFVPGTWLGIMVIVLMHELGHGVLVRLRGGRVTGVSLHALGGECAYVGASGPFDRAIIAWGGVLGQALALVVAYVVLASGALPAVPLLHDFFGVMVGWNVMVIVINLLPVPPLDGSRAWGLIPMLRARATRGGTPKRRR